MGHFDDRMEVLRSPKLPAGDHAGRTFFRETVTRLAQALRRRNTGEIASVGALATSLITPQRGIEAARHRAGTILEMVLLQLTEAGSETIRAMAEAAIDDLPHLRSKAALQHRLSVLWQEMAACNQSAKRPQAARLPAVLERYLAGQLGTHISLGALAAAAGYSPGHVSGMIRRLTGLRFTALRREMQLTHARALLAGGTSVKEAALAAGFGDPAYFSRVFRRHYGMPPSRWGKTPQNPEHARLP